LIDDINKEWPRFPKFCELYGSQYVVKSKSDKVMTNTNGAVTDTFFKTMVDSNFKDYKHSKAWVNLGRKLLFCTHHNMICDFFEVSSQFGLNPVFPQQVHDTEANLKLALYMK
jgi:hypothetical protein